MNENKGEHWLKEGHSSCWPVSMDFDLGSVCVFYFFFVSVDLNDIMCVLLA